MEAGFACGSMVLSFSFFTNMLHIVQHVCEKRWLLPPCRRRHELPGQGPRNSCQI